ncbi:MAG: hypothetical protein QOK07_205 [Gemmatimonadaceae bacterium]|jgi:hypothetical protein|nr:hypothetical protein [Gemmatimonadaceae bacterium]
MRRTAQLLAGIAILGGCTGAQNPTESAAHFSSPAANASFGADVNKDLATLRQVTAAFQQFDNASAAGWKAQITGCMTDANGAGGMGFHYGNTSLINGTVSVDKPELLLYEPEKNGRLRLVAVEYIIPYTFHSRESAPPVLFGQEFKQNDTFKLWGLHAWVWKENPSGMFASWNPKVTCENATNATAMTH